MTLNYPEKPKRWRRCGVSSDGGKVCQKLTTHRQCKIDCRAGLPAIRLGYEIHVVGDGTGCAHSSHRVCGARTPSVARSSPMASAPAGSAAWELAPRSRPRRSAILTTGGRTGESSSCCSSNEHVMYTHALRRCDEGHAVTTPIRTAPPGLEAGHATSQRPQYLLWIPAEAGPFPSCFPSTSLRPPERSLRERIGREV